jgi:hypothetical protein
MSHFAFASFASFYLSRFASNELKVLFTDAFVKFIFFFLFFNRFRSFSLLFISLLIYLPYFLSFRLEYSLFVLPNFFTLLSNPKFFLKALNSYQDNFSLFILILPSLLNVWLLVFIWNSLLHFSIYPCTNSRRN